MSSAPSLADPRGTAAAMRTVAAAYLRQAAHAAGVQDDASAVWAAFGIWVPAEDPALAAHQLHQLFAECSPSHPIVVEALWKDWHADAPSWWRTTIMDIEPDPSRPWMRVGWADPATSMMELSDVAAVRSCPDVLPLSCHHADTPSFLRPPSPPDDLHPQVEITATEADTLITHYLHRESHRIGPLWTTIDAQAASTRDHLMQVIRTAASSAARTEVNVVTWVYDTQVPCTTHNYQRLPDYAIDGDLTCGTRMVAHLHRDATLGWEGNLDHVRAVLTVAALYGGSVHVATTTQDHGRASVTDEIVYKVFYDWRAERVGHPHAGDPAS